MKDEKRNPFPGFQEHDIDFAPTFKYDVWRSIKATNRELRRSLRRRGTFEGSNARRPSLADIHGHGEALTGVPETEGDSEENSRHDIETASRRSMESTVYGESTAGSVMGTDTEDLDDWSNSVDASAYGSRHRALEAALKEKTRNFLSFVKMDKVIGTSPNGRGFLGRGSRKQDRKMSVDTSYSDPRRSSISSATSFDVPRTPIMDAPERIPFSSPQSAKYSFGGQSYSAPRRPSVDASSLATSPHQYMGRRQSMLKRTVSGRSTRGEDGRSDFSHDVEIDEHQDYREGVYDSSKKQRVPSWVSVFALTVSFL